jgi:ferredoxin
MTEGGRWKVVADLDLCQAHQACLSEAPDIFGFDPAADKVVVHQEYPDDQLRAQAKQAVVHCPAMALWVVESPIEED